MENEQRESQIRQIGRLAIDHYHERQAVRFLKNRRFNLPCTESNGGFSPFSEDETPPCYKELRDGNILLDECCDNCKKNIPLTNDMNKASMRGRVARIKQINLIKKVIRP